MRWPWSAPVDEPAVVDTRVAERLEEVAARLEQVAAQLAAKVEQYRQEDQEEKDARP